MNTLVVFAVVLVAAIEAGVNHCESPNKKCGDECITDTINKLCCDNSTIELYAEYARCGATGCYNYGENEICCHKKVYSHEYMNCNGKCIKTDNCPGPKHH